MGPPERTEAKNSVNSDYLEINLNVKQRRSYNRAMQFPERIPGLRLATFLIGAYAAVWIALEGNLVRVMLLAIGITFLSLIYGSRRLGGRRLSRRAWLGFAGLFGLALGAGSGMLTLVLMALKTGLHAHGPEFSSAEIEWVVGQLPWWAAGGLTAGLGLGMVALGMWGDGG